MSAKKAWCRLQQKHSPSQKTKLSPIKHVCYNAAVMKDLIKDPYTKPHIWTLLNTEEFYYQTTCSVVFHEFQDQQKLSKLLKNTRIKVKWEKRLKDLDIIGQGTFGDVFKARDRITRKFYALKRVVKRMDIDLYAEIFIRNLLQEKSTLAELNKSEFFVKLIGAFQEPGNGAYWFVFEYCLCDLRKFASIYPNFYDDDYTHHEYLHGNLMEQVNEYLSNIYKMDYKRLVFIYLFEMLCALHYLATKHIKHADLKLDNILVSTTGHIKMADFGLAFADNWFYRNSISILVVNDEYKGYVDELDSDELEKGNPLHHDPEMVISAILKRKPQMIKKIQSFYKKSPYMNRLSSFEQIFLTDLFAVGYIAVQLLFGGLNLKIRPKEYQSYLSISWAVDISYNETIYEAFIAKPFAGCSRERRISSVMTFLASLFKPREVRAEGFLSTIKIFDNGKVKEEKYIDINLVEQIIYYKAHSINKMNVLNTILPKCFIDAVIENCQQTVQDLKPSLEDDDRKVLNIPGFEFTDNECLN